MDHSVKVMNTHRKMAFSRLFNQRCFENSELEALYHRYIFKLQQSSIISALIVLALLSFVMAVLQFWYYQAATANVIGTYSLLQFLIFLGLFLLSFRMHDRQLLALCYVIISMCTLFCFLLLPFELHLSNLFGSGADWWTVPSRPAEGVWPIVFVIFLTYTMLPIKLWISVLFSTSLSAAHIVLSITIYHQHETDELHRHFIYKQVGDFLFFKHSKKQNIPS